jgi:hypothetical protein
MEALWEKLLFWKKPKMLKENVDFRFMDLGETDITAVELLLDKYQGVIYHYHKARVLEENGIARLQFGYTIYHPGKYDIDDLNSDEEFHIIMGDILSIVLVSKAKEDESFRNNNIEESHL